MMNFEQRKSDDAQSTKEETGTDRLEQAFQLVASDLYEANVAAQICNSFIQKHDRLAAEPLEQQQIWGFFDQAVCWKPALALERLTQNAGTDRASLKGLLREIAAARENGTSLADEQRFEEAEANLTTALDDDICKSLRNSRNAFIGHSLIGENRQGVAVYDLMEYLGKLESIAEALHVGVFGTHLDFTSIDDWQESAATWFERCAELREAEAAKLEKRAARLRRSRPLRHHGLHSGGPVAALLRRSAKKLRAMALEARGFAEDQHRLGPKAKLTVD